VYGSGIYYTRSGDANMLFCRCFHDGCAGITKYAADSLGDVVYAALPDLGTELEVNMECGALGKRTVMFT
jgi:glycine cleavage system H lipoate-binding protein